MSIGTKIIENAYAMIGAHSIAQPAQPDQLAAGRDILNSMMQQWLSLKIDLNHNPLVAVGDDLEEPPDATLAIEENLALKLAPGVGRIASQELRDSARADYYTVKSLFQRLTVGKKVVSSTTPKGEGNSRGKWNRVFFNKGETISN